MIKAWILILSLLFSALSCTSKPAAPGTDADRKPSADAEVKNYPDDIFENGFVILDVLEPTLYDKQDQKFIQPLMYPEDLQKVKDLKLKPFKPLYNFVIKKDPAGDKEEPWLAANLDVTKAEDALKLSKILQRYAYEGWFDKDKTKDKTDYESHFRENKYRSWCQTPWLNVSEKGREAIHGLTKEFPISSNTIYTVPDEIERKKQATSWGVAFFNRPVCDGYDNFFHPAKLDKKYKDAEAGIAAMIAEKRPDFKSRDGVVSVKILFNAMENWEENMKGQWTVPNADASKPENKAYNWYAHVSHAENDKAVKNGDESIRHIQNIPHVQMDIGFKDSRVKGTEKGVKNWIMTSYYYDPTYNNNELLADLKMPEALKHMRPIGLQYGLDAGKSHIFEGSHNNHYVDGHEPAREATRLNGPLDNKSSACLSCHAVSGINFGLADKDGKPTFAPMLGFMSQADYETYLKMTKGGSFDFDMQLDKAMRNFSKAKGGKIFPQNIK